MAAMCSFFSFSEEGQARSAFVLLQSNWDQAEGTIQSRSSSSSQHTQRESFVYEDIFYVYSRIENTLLLSAAPLSQKELLQDTVKDLGY